MGKASREKQERKFQQDPAHGFSSKRNLLEKIYLIIIEAGVYLALITPFIIDKNYFFPYVVPKTIFFRTVVDIIFIIYIFLIIVNRRYLPRLSILTVSVTAFLLVSVLTSITGINFEKSFWSTFERMGGLLTLLHLFIFFIISTSAFKERRYWERIMAFSVLVGTALSISVLASKDPTDRGGGSIGNSSFMASYVLFNVFFAIILFFTKNWGWKIFSGTTFLIMLSVILFNPIEATRGAIGAFFGGAFMLVVGYMIFSKNKLFVRLAPAILIGGILLILVFSQTSFFKVKMLDIRQLPGWARSLVWQEALDAWKEKPLLGWGQENFNVPFVKYFKPELPLTADIWYDRAHNVVLDNLVSSGIVGLLSYLSIFGIACWGLLKLCSRVIERKNLFFPLGMLVILATYFVQNIWVFDMISTYMLFFLSLAFIDFLITTNSVQSLENTEEEGQKKFSPFLGSLLLIIASALLYFGNIQPALASRYIIQGLILPYDKAIIYFEKAFKKTPMSQPEASEQLVSRATGLLYDSNQDMLLVEKTAVLAVSELEKTIVKNPQDFRYYLLLGRFYNDWFSQSGKAEKLILAEKFLTKSIELSLKNQQGYWALGQTRIFQGRAGEAIDLMKKAVDLEPRYGVAHWYLALVYKVSGESKLAAQKLQDAQAAGYNWKENLNELKSAIEIYQELGEEEVLSDLYSLAIKKDSNDAKLWAGLAVTQANFKMYKEAKESAQKAISLNPDFVSELEEFLKSLPQ